MTVENIYSDIEKATLQFIISYGSVRDEYLESTHQKFRAEFEEDNLSEELNQKLRERTIEESIDLINTRLHPLHYQIVKVLSQGLREVHYVYINTSSDSPSKGFTAHSPKEIDIIKKMIDTIFTDNDECEKYLIGAKEAVKFCHEEGLTGMQSEYFLNRLIHEGWFNFSRNGKYTLSLRSLAELKRNLLEKYGAKSLDNDEGFVNLCIGCKEIVTIGVRCPNTSCNARFHKECQRHYERVNNSQVCPNTNCQSDWGEEKRLYVGESSLKLRAVD